MKRLTKAQKEDQQRAALLQRVSDIYSGAMGGEWDSEQFATAEILSRVIPAMQELFDPNKGREWLFNSHRLVQFDTAATATDHLFEHGIRA